MRINVLPVVFFGFILLAAIGCKGKPSDVPATFPCRITVKNGSAPIEGVSVVMGITTGSASWSVSGTTGASGVAEMETVHLGWKGSGAPEGEYKVTLSKTPKLERISADEYSNMSPIEQERYNIEQDKKLAAMPRDVPQSLNSFEETPFTIKVASGGENSLDIDVSTVTQKK